jgi:hypothetical protein
VLVIKIFTIIVIEPARSGHGKVDNVANKLVEKNIERKKVDETFKLSEGILLGEVKVEACKMTPNRKKELLEIGKPNQVISSEEIQKRKKNGLLDYIVYSNTIFLKL